MGKPSPCSEEFRADAVRLVVESTPPRSINEVALELGLNREALRSWVRRSEKEAASVAGAGACLARDVSTVPCQPDGVGDLPIVGKAGLCDPSAEGIVGVSPDLAAGRGRLYEPAVGVPRVCPHSVLT